MTIQDITKIANRVNRQLRSFYGQPSWSVSAVFSNCVIESLNNELTHSFSITISHRVVPEPETDKWDTWYQLSWNSWDSPKDIRKKNKEFKEFLASITF